MAEPVKLAVALICFALTSFAAHLDTLPSLIFCLVHCVAITWFIYLFGRGLRLYLLPRYAFTADPPWRRSVIILVFLVAMSCVINVMERSYLGSAYLRAGWIPAGVGDRFFSADLLVRICALVLISGYFSAQLSFRRMEISLQLQAEAERDAAVARRERDAAELQRRQAEIETRAAQQLATEAELNALKMQINPHFLFNTLGSIAALSRIDGARAGEMSEKLADMFRYTLQASKHPSTTLGEELNFLRSYFEIEKARFGHRLQMDIEIPANLNGLRVPNLILQPLVENAIAHAFTERPDGWHIRVSAATDPGSGDLHLTVTDNGRGFPGPTPADSIGRGTALRNIDERLRRQYGPAHRLRIDHRPGGGAIVTLPIPSHLPTLS
mgnify:CR=1 FL=1